MDKKKQSGNIKELEQRLAKVDHNRVLEMICEYKQIAEEDGEDYINVFAKPGFIAKELGIKVCDLNALVDLGVIKQDEGGWIAVSDTLEVLEGMAEKTRKSSCDLEQRPMEMETPEYCAGIQERLQNLDFDNCFKVVQDLKTLARKERKDFDFLYLKHRDIESDFGIKRRDLNALNELGVIDKDECGYFSAKDILALITRTKELKAVGK